MTQKEQLSVADPQKFKTEILEALQQFAQDQSSAKNYLETVRELNEWLLKKDPHADS